MVSQRRRLGVLLAMNLAMIAVLVVAGLLTGSLGLLAAGGDYVADSSAILLGIVAVAVRDRAGQRSRAPAYVAGINAAVLLTGSALVVLEAARRLLHGAPDIQALPVVVVATVSAALMVAGVFVLGVRAGGEDLHMRSVLLDTAADALASAAVAVSAVVIYVTGRFPWLDPALSLLIGLLVAATATRLLASVVTSLRRGTPLDLDDD